MTACPWERRPTVRSLPAWAELSRLRVERARKAGMIESLQKEVADMDLAIESLEAKVRAGVIQ